MHFLRAIGVGEGKHFDFGKLMDPVQTPRFTSGSTCFGSVTMGQSCVKQGELVRVDDLVRQQPAKSDFRGGDQGKVTVLNGVDLCFLAPWVEAYAVQNLVSGEIRGHERSEALLTEQVQCVIRESQFQENRLVFEIIKLLSRHLGPAFKIDQVEGFHQIHMVLGFEIKLRDLAHLPQREVVFIGQADR